MTNIELNAAELSLAEQLSLLTKEQRDEAIKGIDGEALKYDWNFWGRPKQLRLINEEFVLAILMSGRGGGKTRSGSEWARKKAQTMPGSRGALVARTSADVRDVLVTGDSGIMSVCPPSERPNYEPSKRLLTWPNGTTALCFSSESPDQLRGPQFHWSLADELAAWKWLPDDSGLNAWNNLQIATRLGENPQIVVMTTPKRTEFMKELLAETDKEGVLVLRGSTKENLSNLSQTYIDRIYGLYGGTALALQELEGMMLDDIEGALLTMDVIDEARVSAVPRGARLVVVGVDPSVAENPRDECGIIVATSTTEPQLFRRHAYVLEDASVFGSPKVWAEAVADTARRWNAPVIAEKNQGGALVKMTLQNVDPLIRVLEVTARQNKQTRAEPVVAAYQQCVTTDTLISTARGQVPITEIRTTDYVHTRQGLRRVLWCGETGTYPVVQVEAGNRQLTCTKEHPIYVPGRGFVAASALEHGDELLVSFDVCQNEVKNLAASTAGMNAQSLQNVVSRATLAIDGPPVPSAKSRVSLLSSMEFATTDNAMGTGEQDGEDQATENFCIGLCGNLFMAPLIQHSMFTTSTMTRATTTSLTSRCKCLQIMQSITTQRVLGSTSKIQGKQSNVLNARAHGNENFKNAFVMSVGRNFSHEQHELDSAASSATLPIGMLSNGAVEKVSPAGTSPVWNLMIEDQPEFFANGILTHNCRVHHVGELPDLESQWVSWVPDRTTKSPDRVDAAVWALTGLLAAPPKGLYRSPIRAASPAKARINVGRGNNFFTKRSIR